MPGCKRREIATRNDFVARKKRNLYRVRQNSGIGFGAIEFVKYIGKESNSLEVLASRLSRSRAIGWQRKSDKGQIEEFRSSLFPSTLLCFKCYRWQTRACSLFR